MTAPFKKGDRIKLVSMGKDDPNPVPAGTLGTVRGKPNEFQGKWQVAVAWDNGRSLALVVPPDCAVLA